MSASISMVSWNVNGMRSILKKNFYEFFEKEKPDFLCLQETRLGNHDVPVQIGYHQYWNSAQKLGYAGTAIFTRFPPLSVRKNLGIEEHDQEGRVLTLEYEKFFLVNVYTPNAQPELKRLPYRADKWDVEFFNFLKKLEQSKPVIVCGDLNVAHQEIDLARPKENVGNPGFTDEERRGFNRLMEGDFIDSFRHLHKEGGNYTWWSYRTNARARNIGWRIDYFLLSQALQPYLLEAHILSEVLGSDHCPVSIRVAASLLD